MEESLKANAKNAMFERDFLVSFNKYMNDKKENPNKLYADKVDPSEYNIAPAKMG